MDEVEAQEILDRIEEDLDIPEGVVSQLDKEQFSALVEHWGEQRSIETDKPFNISENFFKKLDENR